MNLSSFNERRGAACSARDYCELINSSLLSRSAILTMHHYQTLPVLALLLALSPSVSAGPPPASSSTTTTTAATDRARSLHIDGANLYNEGKYEQAYVA